MSFNLDDYIDAAASLAWVRENYPEASLQPTDPLRPFWIETIGDKTFIVYSASLYRTPEDMRPGQACAWEPFPGLTPYTRGSELMNAETSAWARACRAVMMPTKKIASTEEVKLSRERQAPTEDLWQTAQPTRSGHDKDQESSFDPPTCAHGLMRFWAPKDKPGSGAYYCKLGKDDPDKCERVSA